VDKKYFSTEAVDKFVDIILKRPSNRHYVAEIDKLFKKQTNIIS
jgi:hypothetical protein